MDTSIALYFRDEFRQARAVAFREAESFEEVIFNLKNKEFDKIGGPCRTVNCCRVLGG